MRLQLSRKYRHNLWSGDWKVKYRYCIVKFKSKKSSKSKKFRPTYVTSDSSSDESDTPSMERLKSSTIQRKVDRRIRDLNHSSHLPGNDNSVKLKSKRGGTVEVSVKSKVSWPHETILGGVSRLKGHCRLPNLYRVFVRISWRKDVMKESILWCRTRVI